MALLTTAVLGVALAQAYPARASESTRTLQPATAVLATATPSESPASTPTPAPTPAPTDTPDNAGPCGISPILHAFCDAGHAIQNAPGAIVGGIASGVGDSIIGAMTRWVADGAAWVLNQVTDLMQTATTPDLTAHWFQRNYATMATLAGVLLAIFLFFATVQGLLANRPSMILRAYLVHAPMAVLGTVLAIALVSRGLQATDAMSAAVSAHLQHDVTRVAERVGEAVVVASRATGNGSLFVAFLGALIAVVVAVILWLELLTRQAAIDLCVLFLPLVLAAFVWPATTKWLRRLINTLTAVVLSKFVIVAVLALSASALADNVSDGGIKAILVGVVLLVLAALCPYLIFRLLPGVELAISGRWLHGGMRMASRHGPTAPSGGPRSLRAMSSRAGRAAAVSVAPWASVAATGAAAVARAARTPRSTTSVTAEAPHPTRPRGGARPKVSDPRPPRPGPPTPRGSGDE